MVSLERALELKKLIYERFISEDGLMCTRDKSIDERDPYGNSQLRTVKNDNGILFLSEFYWVLHLLNILDESDKEHFLATVTRLKSVIDKGLFDRNPSRVDSLDSLDNYVGIVSGAVLFDLQKEIIAPIIEDGTRSGFLFNNTNSSDSDLRSTRVPGEIAFYKLGNSDCPNYFEFLWFMVGLALSCIEDQTNSSNYLLSWLRVRALDKCFKKTGSVLSILYFEIYEFAASQFRKKFKSVGGLEYFINTYFPPDTNHPLRELVHELEF